MAYRVPRYPGPLGQFRVHGTRSMTHHRYVNIIRLFHYSSFSTQGPTTKFHFVANMSTMFSQMDLPECYQKAKELGFRAVECQFPYNTSIEKLVQAKEKANVSHTLINSYPGKLPDFGFASINDEAFLESLKKSIDYAKGLGCQNIHIIAGMENRSIPFKTQEEKYIKNLQISASMLAEANIVGVIEPLCSIVKPGYFLRSFKKAIRYIDEVGSPNIKLLLDIYHLQMIHGNLTEYIHKAMPYTGYVQISQAPDRIQPGALGEINYKYILKVLSKANYEGCIGLEYFPTDNVNDYGLAFIKEYGLEDNM